MKRQTVLSCLLFSSFLFLAAVKANKLDVEAPNGYPVHSLDTGLNCTSIQGAISAPETLNGHTIFVQEGTYYENVVVRGLLC